MDVKGLIMDTWLVTQEILRSWKDPTFRQQAGNSNRERLTEYIKQNDGLIPGTVTLGRIANDDTLWLVDGRCRRDAAMLSGLEKFVVDVRVFMFDTQEDMAGVFIKLHTREG